MLAEFVVCHTRESGYPDLHVAVRFKAMDFRFRGNDGVEDWLEVPG
jgi:hypothetical protein